MAKTAHAPKASNETIHGDVILRPYLQDIPRGVASMAAARISDEERRRMPSCWPRVRRLGDCIRRSTGGGARAARIRDAMAGRDKACPPLAQAGPPWCFRRHRRTSPRQARSQPHRIYAPPGHVDEPRPTGVVIAGPGPRAHGHSTTLGRPAGHLPGAKVPRTRACGPQVPQACSAVRLGDAASAPCDTDLTVGGRCGCPSRTDGGGAGRSLTASGARCGHG